MIVNVNQCASMFDETLHVFKFSAIAKQVNKSAGSVKSGSALVEADLSLLLHLLMIENNDSKFKKNYVYMYCMNCCSITGGHNSKARYQNQTAAISQEDSRHKEESRLH